MGISNLCTTSRDELHVYGADKKYHGFRAKPGFPNPKNRIFGAIDCGATPGWVHRCNDMLVFVVEGECCHYCSEGWFGAFCEHGEWPHECHKCPPGLWERISNFFWWHLYGKWTG